jgi:hypothetical protein
VTLLFDRRATVTVDTIRFTALDFSFTIEKSLKPEPNTCELTILNLSEDHCAELELLAPKTGKRATQGIPCKIEAGYKDSVSQLWLGDLRTVETVIDGPDRVTRLSSGDGEKAWQNARLHVSYGPKTPIETAIRAIVRALGVGEGNIGKVVSKLKIAGSALFPTGAVVSGSAARELVDIARSADLEVSIQDGALQFLDRGKALAGQAIRLAPGTGMIGSPTVDNEGILTVESLIIPGLKPGALIVVEGKRVKGNFRAAKCTWSGDTAGEDWKITTEAERY